MRPQKSERDICVYIHASFLKVLVKKGPLGTLPFPNMS